MGLASSQTVRALGATVIAVLALLLGSVNAQGAVSDHPQVAVDGDGNAHFTWERTDGIDIVKTRVRNANGGLGAVQDLSAAGQNATAPQVAVDPQGNAYFVWLRFNGSNWIVQTRKRNANGTLSAVQDLSAAGQDAAFQPQVAVDPQGNAYFTWPRSNGTNLIVQTRKRNANGTLSAVQNLSAAGQDAFSPQVAVDPQGIAYFTWVRSNGTNFFVQFRRRAAGGTLDSGQNLSAAGQNSGSPQVAVDPQGNAYFVWERVVAVGDEIVQTRRRAAAGGLSAVQDLSDPGFEVDSPQLAVDPQGNASFVWQRAEEIQTRRRAAGGALGAVEDVAATGAISGVPQVAVDPTGTASFVWAGLNSSFDEIVRTRRRTADGVFSMELDLSLAGMDADDQQLGVDPLGNAFFVWERGDIIQTRKRAPNGTLTAAQNVTG